jgi:hypothetical protein
MPTAQYLATRKILEKLLRIESHHHDNGNVLNQTSMDIDLFNTNLPDEMVRLIGEKSFGVFWSFGENSMRLFKDGRQISNRHKRCIREED